jgi:hypothetical protein
VRGPKSGLLANGIFHGMAEFAHFAVYYIRKEILCEAGQWVITIWVGATAKAPFPQKRKIMKILLANLDFF